MPAGYPPAERRVLEYKAYGTLGYFIVKSLKCPETSKYIAELCNGSTYDSDSYRLGSNPSSAAKNKEHAFRRDFCFWKL